MDKDWHKALRLHIYPNTNSGEHWHWDSQAEPIELFFDCLIQVQPQVSCLCPRKTRSSAGRSTTSSSSPLLDFSGAKTHFSLIFYPWMTNIKTQPIFWWICEDDRNWHLRNGDFVRYTGDLMDEFEILDWVVDRQTLEIPGEILSWCWDTDNLCKLDVFEVQ